MTSPMTCDIEENFTERIYVVTTEGSEAKPLVDFRPPRSAIKGTRIPTSVAWSSDNKKLVFYNEVQRQDDPKAPSDSPEKSLMLFDLTTGELVELYPPRPRIVRTALITSQAWAPDNRRLVYVDERGHAVILDTVTRVQEDLGPGIHPTWSPDGRFIALQQYVPKPNRIKDGLGEYLPITAGDYVLVSSDPPYQRKLLLANPLPGFISRAKYIGPGLWTPDGRFVLVQRLTAGLLNERVEWFVLDGLSGEIEKLSFPFRGSSIGGKP
jgi:dipeptidyl aminopeptidase/acylaminoacyl peptidase